MDKLIKELHTIFNIINAEKFNEELPSPVITIQREKTKKKDSRILGWCIKLPVWTRILKGNQTHHYEINMVLDYIDRPIDELISTMLHETVHLIHNHKGIKGTNRKVYHNDEFRKTAESLGLVVEQTELGWNKTRLSDELWTKMQELDRLEVISFDNLTLKKVVDVDKVRKPVNRKPVYTYICPNCKIELKSKDNYVEAKCIKCGVNFEVKENEKSE